MKDTDYRRVQKTVPSEHTEAEQKEAPELQLREADEIRLLVAKACRGDGDAFAEAVTLLQVPLYRVARAYLDSESDIADALQETILNAWKSIADLRQTDYFKTWMIRILIRECLKIRSRRKNEVSYEAVFEPGDAQKTIPFPERASERGEWQPGSGMVFEEMMELLEEPVREVFVLYYGERYSTPEIAELLMMSEAAVRQRLSRGRRVIREKYFREEAAK